MFKRLAGLFSTNIGIDLGTANTLVYIQGRGIVLREPSVVAIDTENRNVVAVGEEAKRMLGRTPANLTALRPLRDGVIADHEVTEAMMKHFVKRVHRGKKFAFPVMVIAVPSGITPAERRQVKTSARNAGAREVYLVEEPIAAAIGVGLPIHEAAGHMIIDIGGGTSAVAILSIGGIVFSRGIRVAGDEMDESIAAYVKRAYGLAIGERTSEEVKIKIGSVFPLEKELTMEIKGRDIVSSLPRTLSITSQEVREALLGPTRLILDCIRICLDRCPPELASDLVDRGIVLAGGGALVRGMDQLIAEETGLPVHVAEEPMNAVVEGTGKFLDDIRFLRRVAREEPEG